MEGTSDLPSGYVILPVGKLANAVTWLDLQRREARRLAEPIRLVKATAADREICRALFSDVGAPWLWSRAYVDLGWIPQHVFIAVDDAGERIGIAELSSEDAIEIEIVYFGLVPALAGKGLGRRMMAAVLERCWQAAADRVWLHTCNFDHPAALRFYRSCGFVPYATGFEIMDDPRLNGSLPRSAAPHVPVIEPGRR